jgi:tRNA(Ile)-lysidine synthetase-like protein
MPHSSSPSLQDSLAMARLCIDMQHIYQWRLALAHFDHRWRADSEANAQYVQQLADQWQLPCYHTTAHAGVRTEADAREWRYSSLYDLAVAHGYSHVATGHTASDVVETLLFNLFRGGGTDGMQALAWRRALGPAVSLVRPLLGLTRQETADLCQLAEVAVWEDTTNEDLKYARNRIRNELLPYLRQHFNSRLDYSVAELAEIVRDEVHCLDVQARQLLARALVREQEEEQQGHQQGQQQQQQQQGQLGDAGVQQMQVYSSNGAGVAYGSAAQMQHAFGSQQAAAAAAAAFSTSAAPAAEVQVADACWRGEQQEHQEQEQQQQHQEEERQHVPILPHCYKEDATSSSTAFSSTEAGNISSSPWGASEDGELQQDLLLMPHACALDRRVLREAPVALQRRAVRLFLQAALRRGFNFSLVEQVVALVSAANRSQTDHLLQTTFAYVDGNYIRLRSL